MNASLIVSWFWLLNFRTDSDMFLSLLFDPALEEFRLCNFIYIVQIFAFKSLSLSSFCFMTTLRSRISSWICRISLAFFLFSSASSLMRWAVSISRFSTMRSSSFSMSRISPLDYLIFSVTICVYSVIVSFYSSISRSYF